MADIVSDSTVWKSEYPDLDSDDHEASSDEKFFPHHSSMAKVKRDERESAENSES